MARRPAEPRDTSGRALVWLRADLRTTDNTALAAACSDSLRAVIALFIVTPDQWRDHDWAGAKVDFIRRTLGELSAALARLNIPLLIETEPRFTGIPDLLLRIARQHRCDSLYFNNEYEVNERRRDDSVEEAFESAALAVRRFTDQVLVEPGRVRSAGGRFYTVFTPFKKALYKHLEGDPAQVFPPPKKRPAGPLVPSPIPAIPGFGSTVDPRLWPAGEREAARRLHGFIAHKIATYNTDRDFPALDGTSTLSPYLTVGAISVRQCLHAALDVNKGRLAAGAAGPATWIGELAWREFYKHVLVGFSRVSMHRAFKPETERIRWQNDPALFEAWCNGRTGVPIVDAAMRQLASTGWMHNRCRMVTAMYLTKSLFIDWRWGERHFMQHLIDGDLASNNGGWQWSASTGTDSAPYFRIFNPASQGRAFDPDGGYIRRYVPELAHIKGKDIYDPGSLAAQYPRPIVEHAVARERTIKAFRSLRS